MLTRLTRFSLGFCSLIATLAMGSIVCAEDGHRSSYYKDGEIHVNVLGQPEGKPITTGHWDFKPSWSQTGDHLVFFRRLKNDPVVSNWITQLCIINADGKKQTRWIHSNHSYKSGGALDAHFGLGKATNAKITVTLLDGRSKSFERLAVDKTHNLTLDTP